MKATIDNQLAGIGGKQPVLVGGNHLQLVEIDHVLSSSIRVVRQQLERDEVASARNRQPQPSGNGKNLGACSDFRFDAAGREQQIDDDAAGDTGAEPRRGKSAKGRLLHHSLDGIPASEQRADGLLSIVVGGHRHGEIGVASEPRFCPR